MMLSQEYELFKPTKAENKQLEKLDDAYLAVSEMTDQERQFLNGLIVRHQPKKLLELGISAGSSSVIMLNAIKNVADAKLYSVDYSKGYYLDKTKLTGFIVDAYPDLKDKWQMFTGGLALEYMDKIGKNIDFCFIDTVHANPGELLDTLMVLPFLKEGAIVAYHDVNLHTFRQKVAYNVQKGYTNNLLMSALHGHKIVQGDFLWTTDKRTYFPNIGAVQITKDTQRHAFEVFNLLTIKWGYCPTKAEEKQLLTFLDKYYDDYLVDYMKKVFAFQRSTPEYEQQISVKALAKATLKKVLGEERINTLRAKKQKA